MNTYNVDGFILSLRIIDDTSNNEYKNRMGNLWCRCVCVYKIYYAYMDNLMFNITIQRQQYQCSIYHDSHNNTESTGTNAGYVMSKIPAR